MIKSDYISIKEDPVDSCYSSVKFRFTTIQIIKTLKYNYNVHLINRAGSICTVQENWSLHQPFSSLNRIRSKIIPYDTI